MMREVLGGCFASHFSDYNETERGLCAIVRGERALFSIFPPVLFIFHQHVCLDSRFPLTHNYRPFPGTKEATVQVQLRRDPVTPLSGRTVASHLHPNTHLWRRLSSHSLPTPLPVISWTLKWNWGQLFGPYYKWGEHQTLRGTSLSTHHL